MSTYHQDGINYNPASSASSALRLRQKPPAFAELPVAFDGKPVTFDGKPVTFNKVPVGFLGLGLY